MRDLATMMWKEGREISGNPRTLRVFAIALLVMGILPSLTFRHTASATLAAFGLVIRAAYILFAAASVVANTAPDLVLHERVGRTLDYLLSTRLPDAAIFAGKVLTAALVGYGAAILATAVQLVASALLSGDGWSWLYLSSPQGLVIAFAAPAALSLYLAVVGTFVALRVGDQRGAYLVTMLCFGVLIVPFALGWLSFATTTAWFAWASAVFGAFSLALGAVGLAIFRRDMLVLYLQE